MVLIKHKEKRAMKEIIYSAQAQKFLSKIVLADSQKIRNKIKQYALAPETLKNQVKRLKGLPFYRLRVGDYRVVFDENGVILNIIKVGHRSDVYKGL